MVYSILSQITGCPEVGLYNDDFIVKYWLKNYNYKSMLI